jgi:hypothetical protein
MDEIDQPVPALLATYDMSYEACCPPARRDGGTPSGPARSRWRNRRDGRCPLVCLPLSSGCLPRAPTRPGSREGRYRPKGGQDLPPLLHRAKLSCRGADLSKILAVGSGGRGASGSLSMSSVPESGSPPAIPEIAARSYSSTAPPASPGVLAVPDPEGKAPNKKGSRRP